MKAMIRYILRSLKDWLKTDEEKAREARMKIIADNQYEQIRKDNPNFNW